MGHFLAVSAIRDRTVDSVANAIVAYANGYDCPCESHADGPPDESRDGLIFSPRDGWTVVLWPSHFTIHDIELCRELSRSLETRVSTIHVYDGDYWVHALVDTGNVSDLYALRPYYFAENPGDAERLATLWSGNADTISRLLDVSSSEVLPYLTHLPADGSSLDRRAFPDDEFTLDDIWVFTDVWRRLGIEYPDPPDRYAAVLRFGRRFDRKLPSSDEFEL